MLLLTLERDAGVPLYLQIVEEIRKMVDGRALGPGDRLPASRALAESLGVNRSTVVRAYQELWALGYLEARSGSYSTVRRRGRALVTPASRSRCLISWEDVASPACRAARAAAVDPAAGTGAAGGGAVSFAGLAADRLLAPVDDLKRSLDRVMRADGRRLADYGSAAGYAPLRHVIAQRMRTHGVTVDADEVLITSGAQHALDLVAGLLVGPGAGVVVESPTYSLALPLFRAAGARLLSVPMLPDGLDLAALEAILRRERPALVYSMPNFHNPTGITTPQAHRERLLSLCEAHAVPLVEDGFEEEMKYFGKAVLPVKSMDQGGVVVYVGTFSKVVFPGLRVGWIAAHPGCIERLVALSRVRCLAAPTLGQAALAHFCAEGRFEAHVRRVHTAYRRRMSALLRALGEHMPASGVSWTRPAGGYTLLVTVEGGGLDETALLALLGRHGVSVAPGSLFFAETPPRPCFRVSISNLEEPAIEEGVRRLGRALRDAVAP